MIAKITYCLVAAVLLFSGRPVTAAGQSVSPAVQRRVGQLLKQMTLEEKVGQMTQVTIEVVSAVKKDSEGPHALDPAKLEDALVNHHVGSIFNVWDSGAFALDHWQ